MENKILFEYICECVFQATVNRSHDEFIVDVTNGISWLRSLVVHLVIVPEWLYIAPASLVVPEGGIVSLGNSSLAVLTEYYRDRVVAYLIVEHPKHGAVMLKDQPLPQASKLERFTLAQLRAGIIEVSRLFLEFISSFG